MKNKTKKAAIAPAFFRGAREVAEYLGVAKSTVYRWKGEGRLPCSRIGATLLFKREDVEKAIAETAQAAVK